MALVGSLLDQVTPWYAPAGATVEVSCWVAATAMDTVAGASVIPVGATYTARLTVGAVRRAATFS
ncbi:hypothetical protein D3C76_1600550 [compost metagenome]